MITGMKGVENQQIKEARLEQIRLHATAVHTEEISMATEQTFSFTGCTFGLLIFCICANTNHLRLSLIIIP